jgi:hypothetical protein
MTGFGRPRSSLNFELFPRVQTRAGSRVFSACIATGGTGIVHLGGAGNPYSYTAQESLLMRSLYVRFLQPIVAIQKNACRGVFKGNRA